MKIKVCGMREDGNTAGVAMLRPDYLGFIFYPPSPRYCVDMPCEVVKNLPEGISPVAVTVNMPEEEIWSLVERYGFRTVQLHGDESVEMCRNMRDKGLTVLKAVGVKDAETIKALREYEGCVDMFVFDTASVARGGTGRKFDWNILNGYDLDIPFLLSGGIGADDAGELKRFSHPQFAGVDLNSRFEKCPGMKDVELLEKFIKEIRE